MKLEQPLWTVSPQHLPEQVVEMDTLCHTFSLINSLSPGSAFGLITHKTEARILEV